MKRKRFLILLVIAFPVLSVMGGCEENSSSLIPGSSHVSDISSSSNLSDIPSSSHASDILSSSLVSDEEASVNLLTGEMTLSPDAVGKRPIAVTIGNSVDSLPQYGISDADVIFEIPVEAGITRLMAMYGDCTKVPQICSVRSARYYFPVLAVGFDALYVHWGQDETIATDMLNMLSMDTMDGMKNSYELFSRDENRLTAGLPYEHTGVFDGTALIKALEDNGVRTQLNEEIQGPFFNFSETTGNSAGDRCGELTVSFGGNYFSRFIYSEEEKVYYKYHGGEEHKDSVSGETLNFSNLIVLETDISVRDDVGRVNVNWEGGDGFSGYYASEGYVRKISWKKAHTNAALEFFTEDGEPLELLPGKTYIAYVSPNFTELAP